ncbi:hypothetical protein [Diaphorobacter sp. J5-51]|uniref:hypothetical protein n=1 Tax=Diaphorobacter sp. J5-51 TaxID=680496 RepID=UPI0012FBBCCB|nr:hypothetical protein [Diaphorobacter sp. J5-51]
MIFRTACIANGMKFEYWRTRPAYRAHCATAHIANKICGIGSEEFGGMGALLTDARCDGLHLFRYLNPHRDQAANELRARVAQMTRQMRNQCRQAKAGATRNQLAISTGLAI